jgi:hypothetical protein
MTRSDGTRAKRRTQPPSVYAPQMPWVGERWHRVAPRVLAFLVAAIVALSGSEQAVAAPRIYECQHPTVTGQGAYDLLHVSAAEACRTVRALARFIHNGAEGWRLYRCVGRSSTATGRPVLVIKRFDGWSLRIVHRFQFVMSRGKSSFAVVGTDFPLNCT